MTRDENIGGGGTYNTIPLLMSVLISSPEEGAKEAVMSLAKEVREKFYKTDYLYKACNIKKDLS